MKSKTKKSWTNVSGLYTAKPKEYFVPKDKKEVIEAVKQAEADKMRIRAHGAGHSSTDIAITDGILLDMTKLDEVSEVNYDLLRPEAATQRLVHVGAGVTLHDLNRKLDDLGLAMRSLGIIDDQTISGAIATGTHGNIPTLPGFPGLVRSIELVAAEGKVYRIEPTHGFTDPAKFKKTEGTLIQSDDTFNSALVHAGAFGIVVSYYLEVEAQYWLYEKRTIEKWSDIKKQVIAGTLFREVEVELEGKIVKMKPLGLHIAVCPHNVELDHRCMVGRFFKLKEEPHRSFLQKIRSLGPNIVARTMFPFAMLINNANDHPEKLPQMLHDGLKMMKDEAYINKSYKVWFQGLEFLADMTFGSEFAYHAEDTQWLKAVDEIFKAFRQLEKDKNIYSPNTLMIRYSAASPAYLAADSEMNTLWIGTPVPKAMRKGREILDLFQEVNIRMGGRSHWGKMNNRVEMHPDLIEKWFPKLGIWKKEMRKFNPKGTFSNAFTDRFGLTDGDSAAGGGVV